MSETVNTVRGMIHSLGEKGNISILEKVGDNDYIVHVQYNGKKCHAIFNPFVGCYYADDVYAVVS